MSQQAVPGQAVSRQAVSRQAVPGQAVSRQAVSRQAVEFPGSDERLAGRLFLPGWAWPPTSPPPVCASPSGGDGPPVAIPPDEETVMTSPDTARSADTAASVPQRFLRGLADMDIAAALDCFADDAVQEMPFAPPGSPRRLEGKAALRQQYGGLPDAYTSMRFDVSAARRMADPEWILLGYRGSMVQRDGSRFDDTYAGLFRVVGGVIVVFREYFDPLVLQQASGERVAETSSLSGDHGP
ncbi:nuclear transport factor 2 family protein [Geodermatophilus sp. URMC 63]